MTDEAQVPIITDSLGFRLKVQIEAGDYDFRGRHHTYESADGHVGADAEHKISIQRGMPASELAEVAAHECFHLFRAIRSLIVVDEETETQVFGQLVKHVYEAAQENPNG